jgi:hypothetical protein
LNFLKPELFDQLDELVNDEHSISLPNIIESVAHNTIEDLPEEPVTEGALTNKQQESLVDAGASVIRSHRSFSDDPSVNTPRSSKGKR